MNLKIRLKRSRIEVPDLRDLSGKSLGYQVRASTTITPWGTFACTGQSHASYKHARRNALCALFVSIAQAVGGV